MMSPVPLKMEAFTGIPEVDEGILLKLDDASLSQLCQVNKYFHSICTSDSFWRERIRRKIGLPYAKEKPTSFSWKEWYIFWRQANTSLVETLSLTPIQGYISIVSGKGDVLPGTELYQTFSLALRKALEKGDHQLVEMLFDKFKKLSDKYFEEPISVDCSLIDYSLLPLALNKGYPDIAEELLRIYRYEVKRAGHDFTRRNWINTQLERDIIGGLGKYNLVDEFYDIMDERDIPNVLVDLVVGLIKGFHNEKAKEITPQLEMDEIIYETLLDTAVVAGNEDFIEYLDSFLLEDQENQELYLSIKDDVLDYEQQSKNYMRKDGVSIPLFSNLSFDQALDEYLKEKKYDNIRIDYSKVPYEMLWYIYLTSKDDKNMLFTLVYYSLLNNRYDFITALKLDDKEIFDRTFWMHFTSNKIITQSKDLLLFVLAHLNRNYPDIYDTCLQLDYSNGKINYEIYLLISELRKIPNKDFPDHVDIVSLLSNIDK